MPVALIPSFLFYCYINGITPGPANLCSLSASLNAGKKVALRQWWGIFIGFFIDAMIAVFLIYFVGEVLGKYIAYFAYVGAAYIIWLAIHILRSTVSPETSKQVNYSIKTGLIVQLTNAKVILFCFTALGTYVAPYSDSFLSLFLVGCFLPFTGPVCNMIWLLTGAKLRNLFINHQKAVNIVMAIALVICAISVVVK